MLDIFLQTLWSFIIFIFIIIIIAGELTVGGGVTSFISLIPGRIAQIPWRNVFAAGSMYRCLQVSKSHGKMNGAHRLRLVLIQNIYSHRCEPVPS